MAILHVPLAAIVLYTKSTNMPKYYTAIKLDQCLLYFTHNMQAHMHAYKLSLSTQGWDYMGNFYMSAVWPDSNSVVLELRSDML